MNNKVFLVEPDTKYKDGFSEMVRAYQQDNDPVFGIPYFELYKDALEDFDTYVTSLHNSAKGIEVEEGWVPVQSFWLTDSEGSIYGVLRIRVSLEHEYIKKYAGNIGYDISPLHRNQGLGTEILRLGLEKAEAFGLDKVLITCFHDNVGSIKIIEANGGEFESEIYNEHRDKLTRRYWIKLS